MELTTSGRSVPIETNTKPIINGEAPKAVAISTECSTAVSLEKISRTNPAIKTKIGIANITIESSTIKYCLL